MADAAVEFLLNNLKYLVIHHARLIKDASGQIENLQTDLRVFNAFLKDSVEKRRDDDDERTKVAVQDIRKVVYELEDIIDTFVNKTIAKSTGISLMPKFLRTPFDLHAIGQQVAKVRGKVEQARADIGLVSLQDEQKPQQSQVTSLPPPQSNVSVSLIDLGLERRFNPRPKTWIVNLKSEKLIVNS